MLITIVIVGIFGTVIVINTFTAVDAVTIVGASLLGGKRFSESVGCSYEKNGPVSSKT